MPWSVGARQGRADVADDWWWLGQPLWLHPDAWIYWSWNLEGTEASKGAKEQSSNTLQFHGGLSAAWKQARI